MMGFVTHLKGSDTSGPAFPTAELHLTVLEHFLQILYIVMQKGASQTYFQERHIISKTHLWLTNHRVCPTVIYLVLCHAFVPMQESEAELSTEL